MWCGCDIQRKAPIETVRLGEVLRPIRQVDVYRCQRCSEYEARRNRLILIAELEADRAVPEAAGKKPVSGKDEWTRAFLRAVDRLWRELDVGKEAE